MKNRLNKESKMLRLFFTAPLLGTQPADPEMIKRWIASRAPTEELEKADLEVAENTPIEMREGKTTIFARDKQGRPCVLNRHIKGMLKDAGDIIRRSQKGKKPQGGTTKWGQIRIKMSDYLHVHPFVIPIEVELNGAKIPTLERSLNVDTPRGKRTSLASSEVLDPAEFSPIEVRCELVIIGESPPITWEMVEEALDVGSYKGLGGWANAQYGTFRWEWE